MSWLRIDDGFAEHPKMEGLSPIAFRLHVAAMCLCARKLTDGHIGTGKDIKTLYIIAGARAKHVAELVAAGLWHKTQTGFEVNDYLNYNPPASKVKTERARAAERQARWRESNAVTNAVTNAVPNGGPSRPVPKNINQRPLSSSPTPGSERERNRRIRSAQEDQDGPDERTSQDHGPVEHPVAAKPGGHVEAEVSVVRNLVQEQFGA